MRRLIAIILVCVAAGCAAPRGRTAVAVPSTSRAATQPADPKALLTLDEIEPRAATAAQPPATSPATAPSLDALEAYARGRSALEERQYYTAVNLLEKSARLDSQSATVSHLLGRAYALSGRNEDAIGALKRAIELSPDLVDAMIDLARLQSRTSAFDAARTLIAASRTASYATNEAQAATIDFLLARLLQAEGYDRAAAGEYEKLVTRLGRRSLAIRSDRDLASLADRPETVQLDLAKLYDRLGRGEAALALHEKIAAADPDSFAAQARVVRSQIALGKAKSAAGRAGELVAQFSGSDSSIDLLQEAYRAAGDEDGAVQALRQISRERPQDRVIVLALSKILTKRGRAAEAEALIAKSAVGDDVNLPMLRYLVTLYARRGETALAATALIQASARRPELASDIAPLWTPLAQLWQTNAIHAGDLEKLNLPAEAEAARQFWVAVLRFESNRDRPALRALDEALKLTPAFAPAFYLRVQRALQDSALDDSARAELFANLAATARRQDAESLALQVEALSAGVNSENTIAKFARAVAAAPPPADFLLSYADVLARAGQPDRADAVLNDLIGTHPDCDRAYNQLFQRYLAENQVPAATRVVDRWAAALPASALARIAHAGLLLRAGQSDAAEALLLDLARERGGEPESLDSLRTLYVTTNRIPRLIQFLQDLVSREPDNGAAIQLLVSAQQFTGATAAAIKVLDDVAPLAAASADRSYFLSRLYYGLNERDKSEQLLSQALNIDARHVASSNDLAFYLADAGRELTRSEALARQAVSAEPENAAYLDTLGWALYKQGRFVDAIEQLSKAVDGDQPVDPVLLDHLGDALYQNGDPTAAGQRWNAAAARLSTVRPLPDELTQLRLEVQNKLRQQAERMPVEVSPVPPQRAG